MEQRYNICPRAFIVLANYLLYGQSHQPGIALSKIRPDVSGACVGSSASQSQVRTKLF
jgi:hypothetical protein